MFNEYKEKLSRRNARIVALWKWRFCILGAFLLLVAGSVLLGLTGSVMNSEAAENYEYGAPIAPAGSALFSAVSFRYRAVGGDWTDEVPFHAGDYEMQAVSRGLAGNPRYGEVRSFTITPAPITVKITDADVDFGNLPQSVTADNLKYGDELVFCDFEVAYHDRSADITPVKDSLRIFDENKNDVTADYLISVQTKTIICNPIGATVATPDGDWVYDGREHDAREVTAEGLLPGHTVGIVSTSAVQNVGSCENEVDCRIFDEDGNDVTVHYVLEKRLGTLTVTARPVTVTTAGLSVEYDGTEHTLSNEPIGELAPGHVFGYRSETITLKTVEKRENSVEFVIKDAAGKEVTSNYSVTKQFGTFEIKKRPLTIITGSARKEYDGKPLSCTTYDDPDSVKTDGLADGEEIFAPFGMENITDAGSKLNTFVRSYKIYAGDVETTPNYDIDEQWGTLTVEPYVIYLQSEDVDVIYDGQKHRKNGTSLNAPISGHVLRLTNWAQRTDAGSEPNIPGTIKVEAGGVDVTRNYSFNTERCGTLTVNKRVLEVTTGSGEFVFDGKRKYVHDYTMQQGALLKRHKVSSYDTTKVTDVTDHDGQIGYVDNMIEFFIIKDSYSGSDVSDNYAVEPMGGEWGKIRVKAPIVVRLLSLSKVYDGTELAYKSTDWRVESLPADIEKDWLKIDLVGNLTKVGTLEAAAVRKQSKVELIDDGGKDLLSTNRVDFVGEPLTVLARPLTVSSVSACLLCEGEALYGKDIPHPAWISFGTLLEGHRAEFSVTGSLNPDQPSVLNTVVVHIFDKDGNDVTDCYAIQYRCGTLSWL